MEGQQAKNNMDENNISAQDNNKPCYKRYRALLILFGILVAIGLAIGIAAIIDGVKGIRVLGDFVTNQILGMQWLNTLIGMAFMGIFGADFMATHWGGAIRFFIYDTIKIIV